ncbi:MAG: VWA domain-containing protein [Bradymonadales bacterium]|nr:VWA domain-containing protein [Bradymonadales bacterium]
MTDDMGERSLEEIKERWRASFEDALGCWSRFTRLSEPRWCLTGEEEKQERLTGSFAMIRLEDHAIVIGLRQVRQLGLQRFCREILAHEIGHHVLAPGDLRDNARLLARIRAGLPTREFMGGMVANLYADLLINDRLQRSADLDIAGVYRLLKGSATSRLWTLIMRIYELLWSLPSGTLCTGQVERSIQGDADLGARLVRAYGKYWLKGAGRFAALCLPYLLEIPTVTTGVLLPPWLDTLEAGSGGALPDGLAEMDDDELEGAIHPAEDPELTGLRGSDKSEEEAARKAAESGGRAMLGGRKNRYRSPTDYLDLMKSVGVTVSQDDLVIRYYRERAIPYLVRYPSLQAPQAAEPLAEGLDLWEAGEPLEEVDWVQSLTRSPVVIPGLTTVKRVYGTTEGSLPDRRPVDLYLGVDCSGSMSNPRYQLSYPVLAGTAIALSALRSGARVMVTLSGEPGSYSTTPGFVRQEREILKVLTGYLGTGYAFGVLRLKETFLDEPPPERPVHILVVSDSDLFAMLDRTPGGWEIAERAVAAARGQATCVLEIPRPDHWVEPLARLRNCGWRVHLVMDMEDLIALAREFSREHYEVTRPRGR